MEQHPVPQNIIEVEFKLFGSFTLKQFIKIMIGCSAGVGFYLLPIPDLIKFPLSAISVILGLGMAIVPNLSIWLNGFTKAIFLSPRYVWVREERTPDLLKPITKAPSDTTQKVRKVTKKIDIDTLPLDKIFASRAKLDSPKQEETILAGNQVKEDNFARVYEDVFGEDIFQRDASSPLNYMPQPAANNPQPAPTQKSETNKTSINKESLQQSIQQFQKEKGPGHHKSVEEYNKEINQLKYELSMLAKDENYQDKEQEILTKINDLYQEIRVLANDNTEKMMLNKIRNSQPQSAETASQGRVVLGIVVDKNDSPIPDVKMTFLNKDSNTAYQTSTLKDGKFSTVNPLPLGHYAVSLEEKSHKFHTYAIEISNQNLPAYKFREK